MNSLNLLTFLNNIKYLIKKYFLKSAKTHNLLIISVVFFSLVFAILFRIELQELLNQKLPLTAFLLSVIISAFFGGFWIGILATLLSIVAGIFFFIPPIYSFSGLESGHVYRITLFAIEGFLISYIAGSLHKSQEQHNLVLENISDAFLSINKKWQFNYLNSKAEEIMGLSREKVVGKTVWELYPQYHNSRLHKKAIKIFNTQQPAEIEFYLEKMKKWFVIRLYPSRNEIGVYMLDITKRKELERKKDEFIGIVSHELKVPITTIKSSSQILQKKIPKHSNNVSYKLLTTIETQTNKITRIINELMDVSRMEIGKFDLDKKKFDINDLINNIVKEFKQMTPTHQILKRGRVIYKISGDADRIGQVLINLISNAIRYSPEGSKIFVQVQADSQQVIIKVKDYGIGIPADAQKKIFKQFYRVRDKDKSHAAGFGLGLYITAEIIKKHGGKIWVESEEEKGSTFSFSIPRE